MRVVTVSIIRNGASLLDRWAAQLVGLRWALAPRGHTLRHIVVEGDSTDGTWAALGPALGARGLDADLAQEHHGGPVYGSVDEAQRWRQISQVYNVAWDRLRPEDDVVLQLDPDLLWAPATLARLVGHLGAVDAVAPLLFLGPTGWLYDTWGMRALDGQRFRPEAPYHPAGPMTGLTEIGSAGGCLAVRAEYARQARFAPPELANVGWCAELRAAGARLWVDPRLGIAHPLPEAVPA